MCGALCAGRLQCAKSKPKAKHSLRSTKWLRIRMECDEHDSCAQKMVCSLTLQPSLASRRWSVPLATEALFNLIKGSVYGAVRGSTWMSRRLPNCCRTRCGKPSVLVNATNRPSKKYPVMSNIVETPRSLQVLPSQHGNTTWKTRGRKTESYDSWCSRSAHTKREGCPFCSQV